MPYASASDGTRLYFEECGDGVPIIFVHEFAGDMWSYEPQLRAFARGFRCIAFNARGYPPSDVPTDQAAYTQQRVCDDIQAVMDHLGLQKAHLLGTSMGGFSCLFFAMAHPDRVISLTVVGCGFGADPKSRPSLQRDLDEAAERVERDGMSKLAEDYASGPARIQFKVKDPRGWEEFRARLAAHSSTGSAMTLRGVQRERPSFYELTKELGELDTPVMIIVGDEDEPCLDASLFLKRRLRNAGLSIFPFTGHAVNLEEPDLFNTVFRNFLDSVDRGARPQRHALARRENVFGLR